MSLQFILGGSGSGKTRCLYENLIAQSLREPDRQYFAIVPEQFTMQTQKEIVTLHPKHGTMNIDIVSFQRLAYRIFEELSVENLSVLDDMGKSMVLRKVAADQKKNLTVFRGHLNKTGFINQLKSMLSELYQYGIGTKELTQAIETSESPLLREKLKDLSVIYRAFQKEIADRYITAEEILDVLCRVLPESRLIRNSVITLDGYTGFTPVQYRLLELLFTYGQKVTVTVTIDPKASPYQTGHIQDLFYMSKQIVCKLTDLAAKNGIGKEADLVLDQVPLPRFIKSPEIGFIEKSIFRYDYKSQAGKPSQIRIHPAANPGSEIAWVASQIHHLVQKESVRYREIAVISGDLVSFRHELVNQFEAEQIPYFLDDKKSILDHSMVELIRAALDVIRLDFSYESVFRYLKTGLVSEQNEKIDRLENYVVALGIRGWKRWNRNWDWEYRGSKYLNLEELNQFREELLAPLRTLRDALKREDRTIRTMTEALVGCLLENRIQEKLERRQLYFESIGDYRLAKEYEQVYPLVMELFDRLVHLLGEEAVSHKEFAEILDAGFAEISVGVIPATVDRVVVGDITRTRLNDIKVLFFVGVNEGMVPAAKATGGILTDVDRESLKKQQMELAPTSKEDGFLQRFYLYLLLTKPSMRLILTYSAFNGAGKSQRPSTLIGDVRHLFPQLSVEEENQEELQIGSFREGKRFLIQGLSHYEQYREDGRFLEIYRLFAQSPDHAQSVHALVDAAFYSYEKRGIGKAVAQALYGTVLQGSVTRLEKYAACAYAHFLNYGLELMERQQYQLAAADMGNLFHNSIDLCFQTLKDQNQNPTDLTAEERKTLVQTCVAQVTSEYGNTILKSSARNQYLVRKVEHITDRTMWALVEQLKKGDFTPTGFEVSFSAADDLRAMKIALSEEEAIHLRGEKVINGAQHITRTPLLGAL
ncbi:MAG: PD-(D/E)XK nuclease family protein [Hungatella sp.]